MANRENMASMANMSSAGLESPDTPVISEGPEISSAARVPPTTTPITTPTTMDIDGVASASASASASSQQSIPSTEGPASPADLDDVESQRVIIPSSLTPPPSSQFPPSQQQQQAHGEINSTDDNNNNNNNNNRNSNSNSAGANANDIDNDLDTNNSQQAAHHPGSQPSSSPSPHRASIPPSSTSISGIPGITGIPAITGVTGTTGTTSDYIPPTTLEISNAPVDRVRHMLHASLAENARLKMETAHHKLQYNLLSMQAEEDAKRAAVEHDMTRREVQALRVAEDSRLTRRELDAAAQTSHAKYLQLKAWYDAAIEEIDGLHKRLRLCKKVIQQKEDDILSLADERDMLLNRIRENREHFHMLCSPGGAFHGALTPKSPPASTPQQQYRTTPRQTPKSLYPRDSRDSRDSRHENDPDQAGVAVLLQALSHDNNSAPSTPLTASRPAPRMPPKHTRGVQSLSSLPTTPASHPHGTDHSGLLPSVHLVPQSEPLHRYGGSRAAPETPTRAARRKSRESTISADDNEELARAALESVAAATQSFMSHGSRRSQRRGEDEEEVSESQASQAASEMLRRDPRETHFEVASSVGSRDGTPAPAEKTAKLQSKLFAGVNKAVSASEKRKLSNSTGVGRDSLASPTKKMRHGNNNETVSQRVGLGIRYSQEA